MSISFLFVFTVSLTVVFMVFLTVLWFRYRDNPKYYKCKYCGGEYVIRKYGRSVILYKVMDGDRIEDKTEELMGCYFKHPYLYKIRKMTIERQGRN